jgi:hypothetical protein
MVQICSRVILLYIAPLNTSGDERSNFFMTHCFAKVLHIGAPCSIQYISHAHCPLAAYDSTFASVLVLRQEHVWAESLK